MPDTATSHGKQVFIGPEWICDARTEELAASIVAALNAPDLIAASLNSLADRCKQRGVARGLRVAADHVRAGLWEETDNG